MGAGAHGERGKAGLKTAMGKKKKKPNEELLKVAAEARAAGMTYGEYTAKRYLEMQMEQKRKQREEEEKITQERQRKHIEEACKEAGLGGHVTWFSDSIKPTTHATSMAADILRKKNFPAKCSFMFCDELDMCFFYSQDGIARVTFSGETKAGSEDIRHNIIMAFKTAEKVLDIMQDLSNSDR